MNKIKEQKKKTISLILIGILVITIVIVVVFYFIFNKNNSPAYKAEEYLEKYNNLDSEVINKIEYNFSDKLSKKQFNRYKKIMKKQYKKMFYSVVSEEILENEATIKVDVTVINYNNCMNKAIDNVTMLSSTYNTPAKQVDYKLSSLEKCKDKVTYTIDFCFKKDGIKWVMDELSEADIDKINGVF